VGTARRPQPGKMPLKLRAIRTRLGLSQEQMASRLSDVPSPPQPGHISRFELGMREPSLLVLLAYARLAGISMDLLVDDELELPKHFPKSKK